MRLKVVTISNADSSGQTYHVEMQYQDIKNPQGLISDARQLGFLRLSWPGLVTVIPWHQIRYFSWEQGDQPTFTQEPSSQAYVESSAQ